MYDDINLDDLTIRKTKAQLLTDALRELIPKFNGREFNHEMLRSAMLRANVTIDSTPVGRKTLMDRALEQLIKDGFLIKTARGGSTHPSIFRQATAPAPADGGLIASEAIGRRKRYGAPRIGGHNHVRGAK